MPNPEIGSLFNKNRLPDNDVKLLLFIAYLPFGLVLVLFRTILILSTAVLARIFFNSPATQKTLGKLACFSLGIVVTVENPQNDDKTEIYVSNCLSIFDDLVVSAATGSVSFASKSPFDSLLNPNPIVFDPSNDPQAFERLFSDPTTTEKRPIHFSPEGRPTNGSALLKFDERPFGTRARLRPVCLRVERPLLGIAVTALGAKWWGDAFYFVFSPVTFFKVRFLAALEKKSWSEVEFAEIARANLAEGLKIAPCDFTASDLTEHEKRADRRDRRRPAADRFSLLPRNANLRRMCAQVKEVLPHVPLGAIYNDLYVTRNVDSTITNILEGRVDFEPEAAVGEAARTAEPEERAADCSKACAIAFGKSAHARTVSFRERKEEMIEKARRRYLEKHGLEA